MTTPTLESFLKHESGSGGGGGKFLQNWKRDENNGEVTIWLAKQKAPAWFWTHNCYRVEGARGDDKDKKESYLRWRTSRFNCMESESITKRQYSRDMDGLREVPPTICPDCLLIEWLRGELNKGKLSWLDPLFNFEGNDPEQEAMVIHVGGFTGMFQEDLADDELRELKRHKIQLSEVHRENALAKLKYIFYVVNDAEPKGVQLAIETKLLGDKMKNEIRKVSTASERSGKGPRDPLSNPYPFLWKFHPKEKQFDKKYEVVPLTDSRPSLEIEDCLNMAIPDDRKVIGPGDITTHRSVLERYCLIKGVPWDQIFEKAQSWEEEHKDDGDEDTEFNPSEFEDGPKGKVSAQVPSGNASHAEDYLPCEACGKPISESDMKCPHCKAEYCEVKSKDGVDVYLKSMHCLACTAKFDLDLDAETPSGICDDCGTTHEFKEPGVWTTKEKNSKFRRRSR